MIVSSQKTCVSTFDATPLAAWPAPSYSAAYLRGQGRLGFCPFYAADLKYLPEADVKENENTRNLFLGKGGRIGNL